MKNAPPNITELDKIVEALPAGDRDLFHRLFHFNITTGRLHAPETTHGWIKDQFGSLESVTSQRIVKITNLVTFEGALFNKLRACRPVERDEGLSLASQISDAPNKPDPFHHPESSTTEDVFGRVRGRHCVTASNIAKYEGMHGIVIFDEYNPLQFSKDEIIDYLDTGWEWARKAREVNPSARYYLFIWNCLHSAGASVFHGHAHVILSSHMHYARIEGLRRAALTYRAAHDSNYFEDLYRVHLSLGCAMEREGVRIISYLTPVKEKEILLLAREYNLSLKERIYEVLACLRDKMNVTAFNLALIPHPLAETEESWEGFPVLARVVDRGDPTAVSCDMGSMELFASSIISSDPLEVARTLKEMLVKGV